MVNRQTNREIRRQGSEFLLTHLHPYKLITFGHWTPHQSTTVTWRRWKNRRDRHLPETSRAHVDEAHSKIQHVAAVPLSLLCWPQATTVGSRPALPHIYTSSCRKQPARRVASACREARCGTGQHVLSTSEDASVLLHALCITICGGVFTLVRLLPAPMPFLWLWFEKSSAGC